VRCSGGPGLVIALWWGLECRRVAGAGRGWRLQLSVANLVGASFWAWAATGTRRAWRTMVDLQSAGPAGLAGLGGGAALLGLVGWVADLLGWRTWAKALGLLRLLYIQCRTCTALHVQGKGTMDLVDLGAVVQGVYSAGVAVFGA